MLKFVCGKTGDGKTKFVTGQIVTELRTTDRPIVTNFALRLQPWVQKRKRKKDVAYPGLLWTLRTVFGSTFDAERRIYFLTEEELYTFWRVRPHIPEDPTAPVEIRRMPAAPDSRFHFDDAMYSGCFYAIDEAHEYFPKEKWKLLEGEGMSWASQNRRCGDDAWVLTQEPGLVAKGFRDQSKECYRMVNHAHRAISIFRQPDAISYGVYLHTPPGDSEPALTRGTLEYRREMLEACYDTNGGASVQGGGADIGYRAKGLHWAFAPGALIAGIVLFMLMLSGCKHALLRAVRGAPAVSKAVAGAVVPHPVVSPVIRTNPLEALRNHKDIIEQEYYGVGHAGSTTVLDTPDGPIMGTQFAQAPGGVVELDGVKFRRSHRPKIDHK